MKTQNQKLTTEIQFSTDENTIFGTIDLIICPNHSTYILIEEDKFLNLQSLFIAVIFFRIDMFINATGFYVPTERVHNDYFLHLNGLTDEWIFQRTGIKTRSKAAENEDINTMAYDAIRNAIPKLPYDLNEVDLIIGASYSALDTVATLAHTVQREFDIKDAKAVYVSSACSSFINALEIAEGYFATGKASKALIVSSEHNTFYSNETDPASGHLWGDAAVAMFISKEKQADGEAEIREIYTRGLAHIGKGTGGVYLRPKTEGIVMPDGRDVFMNACKYMVDAIDYVSGKQGVGREDLAYIITHQANKRIVANVAQQLKLPLERFLSNIEELGNTGSASSALVLAQNIDRIKPGEKVVLTVFGGGYSSGSSFIQF